MAKVDAEVLQQEYDELTSFVQDTMRQRDELRNQAIEANKRRTTIRRMLNVLNNPAAKQTVVGVEALMEEEKRLGG